jgi:alanyl-tRNA synthetase
MKHSEIRRTFLNFYAERGHTIVPSAPLVPRNDPTLLFTNAGMVQFKPLFAGSVELPYRRATSIQKCLRGSDLPEVGRSIKHLTFFEMLGNFSFGDYFKTEGIAWAWEYLTAVVKLDPDRLFPSVYEQDPEAYDIWRRHIGLPENRVFRLGANDNFWGPAGGLGACGPCSEIYFDLGPEFGCGKATCGPGCDCPRFTEVYNVVFPQFDQQADGTRQPLKNRGIDTGMGMERLAMVSQHVNTLFETDLFVPLVKALCRMLELELNADTRMFLRAAVDHARALTFALADGVLPSNEARGYMLRNILRRALLLGQRYGIREPFLYRLTGEVAELMRAWYPELEPRREQTARIVRSEEERFLSTLEAGMARWQELAERYQTAGTVPGSEAFKLHDTFGFHIELTRELATEAKLVIDEPGFEQAMQAQRQRSRKETFLQEGLELQAASAGYQQSFCGYQQDETETRLIAVRPRPDGLLDIELEETPFYAESGGQVGDTGTISGPGFELEVQDTVYVHDTREVRAAVKSGEPQPGSPVRARVDSSRRREIERAHTATHLLHAALRCTLGDYVKQEGSLVEPGRLRFDFVAYEPLTAEQKAKIEQTVYDRIIEDVPVEALRDLPIDEARKLGALAFFGENYGSKVNVIRIGEFSLEFCGGTHLRRTGEIGLFRIASESGIAAGIRRIEALVGREAYARVGAERLVLNELGSALSVEDRLLPQKVSDLTAAARGLESRIDRLSSNLANLLARELVSNAAPTGDIRIVTASYDYLELEDLRLLADAIRREQKNGLAGLLITATQPQIRFLVFVAEDLRERFPAGRLAKATGKLLGGGGGGKPDLAEGGGKRENIGAAVEKFPALFTLSGQ